MSARWVNAWGRCRVAGRATDLLGVEPQVVGGGQHLLEHQPRLVNAAGAGERLDVQNVHDENVPSSPCRPSSRQASLAGNPSRALERDPAHQS